MSSLSLTNRHIKRNFSTRTAYSSEGGIVVSGACLCLSLFVCQCKHDNSCEPLELSSGISGHHPVVERKAKIEMTIGAYRVGDW